MANQSGRYIVTVSLIAAAILWLVTASEPLEPGPINISRGHYESALAKWDTLRVEKYEEIFRDFAGCRFKLVVEVNRISEKGVEDIQQVEELGCASPHNPDLEGFVTPEEMTVGALFEGVDMMLRCPPDCHIENDRRVVPKFIRFDPTMGFPRSIAWEDDYYPMEISVESVKVLK